MTSRLGRLAVELGHRQLESGGEALDLPGLRVGLAQLDATETCCVDLGFHGELVLRDAAQLSPVPNALTRMEAHPNQIAQRAIRVNAASVHVAL